MAYVYLLGEEGDSEMTKIGITTAKDINTRIKKLQTGNGNKIKLLDYFETDVPFKLEKMLHFYFQNDREEGEWFLLNNEQRKQFKEKCKEYQKQMDSLRENPFVFKQS